MRERMRNNLENYLTGSLPAQEHEIFEAMLASNSEEREQLEWMLTQSKLMRETLRTPPEVAAELAPAPGFYARVMARVEAEAQPSFWSIFLEPFGRRVAYASVALLLVMGLLMLSTPTEAEPELAEAPGQVLIDDHPEVHLVGDTADDRDRVFVSLTALDQ